MKNKRHSPVYSNQPENFKFRNIEQGKYIFTEQLFISSGIITHHTFIRMKMKNKSTLTLITYFDNLKAQITFAILVKGKINISTFTEFIEKIKSSHTLKSSVNSEEYPSWLKVNKFIIYIPKMFNRKWLYRKFASQDVILKSYLFRDDSISKLHKDLRKYLKLHFKNNIPTSPTQKDLINLINQFNQEVINKLKTLSNHNDIYIKPSISKSEPIFKSEPISNPEPIIYLHGPKRLLPNYFFNQHNLHGRWSQLRHILVTLYLWILPIWIHFCLVLAFIMWLPIGGMIKEEEIVIPIECEIIEEVVATSSTPWGSIITTFALFTITYLIIGDPFSLKIIPNFIKGITYPLHNKEIVGNIREHSERINDLTIETARLTNERNEAIHKYKEIIEDYNSINKMVENLQDETDLINNLTQEGSRFLNERNEALEGQEILINTLKSTIPTLEKIKTVLDKTGSNMIGEIGELSNRINNLAPKVTQLIEDRNNAIKAHQSTTDMFNSSVSVIDKIQELLTQTGHSIDGKCPFTDWYIKNETTITLLHHKILNSGAYPTQLDLTLANDLSVAISELSVILG